MKTRQAAQRHITGLAIGGWAALFSLVVVLCGLCWACRTAEKAPENQAARRVEFVYEASLEVPDKTGSVRLWTPLPARNEYQEIESLALTCNGKCTTRKDPKYGNWFAYAEYDGARPGKLEVTMRARVVRKAAGVPHAAAAQEAMANSRLFLQPDRLVPTGGKIAAEADSVLAGLREPQFKARALYEHLSRTMLYDKSGVGWGRGDAVYACETRKGNCTDIHSLFIGMARSAKIPARFVIGFPLPPDRTRGAIQGYHCWAEFYLEGTGWVPVDISEAIKYPDKREFFYGGLDADRVEFTSGRDIELGPAPAPAPVNYFIYPIAMVDGQTRENVSWRADFVDVR